MKIYLIFDSDTQKYYRSSQRAKYVGLGWDSEQDRATIYTSIGAARGMVTRLKKTYPETIALCYDLTHINPSEVA